MKMRNKVISLMAVVALMLAMALPVFAVENGITPYYNNTASTEATFTIDENGLATIAFTCRGYRGTTSKIEVDTKIERQVGTSWVEVEGASWADESTLYYCSQSHSVELTQTGTYKATVTFTVTGSGGDADVITRELERTY
ncbi:MAG: hypothetical protein IJX02_08835 [Clostridia bacterium]|nr:hypothetical protein [Clostridia bacterium]